MVSPDPDDTHVEKMQQHFREAPVHCLVHGLLLAVMHQQVGTVDSEYPSSAGRSDLVLKLLENQSHRATTWIVEFGVLLQSQRHDPGTVLTQKLEQAQKYHQPFAAGPCVAGAVIVGKGDFTTAWAEWDPATRVWTKLADPEALANTSVSRS